MRQVFFLLILSLISEGASACASCGCSLSSDWQDASESRFKFDLRYDYINQNQLRSGSNTISPGSASQLNNAGSPQEVEQFTVNNYLTASLEYSINPDWKVSVVTPYIIRSHSTLGQGSDGTTATSGGGQYTSNTASLGDMRLLGRFQGFTPQHNWGILFGLKLPTGANNLYGQSTDPSSPAPVLLDRGIQPGTGTTDSIFGLYYSKALNKNWDGFAEGIYQAAWAPSNQYIPGNSFNANLGTRYLGWESFTPQVQLNARIVQHDSGANADVYSTGGILTYLSPGVVVPVSSGLEIYAFVQVPLYQNLLGVQLSPTSTESLGLRYSF